MTPLFQAALELQDWFNGRQWQEPRFTRVDVTLLTGFGREDRFITLLLSAGYRGRIPEAAEFALRNRVLLLDSPQGGPIDIALGGLPFEALMVERASLYDAAGCGDRSLAELKQQPEIMDLFSKLRRA